jgi:hypothetical protein
MQRLKVFSSLIKKTRAGGKNHCRELQILSYGRLGAGVGSHATQAEV